MPNKSASRSKRPRTRTLSKADVKAVANEFYSFFGDQSPIFTGSDITTERVTIARVSRFNPIRNLTADVMSRQMDEFKAGFLRAFAMTMIAIADRDDMVKTVFPKAKSSVSRHGWDVLVMDGIKDEQKTQAEEDKQYLEYFYNHCCATNAMDQNQERGFSLLVEQMMDAVAYKYAPHELLWQPSPDGLTCKFNYVPLQWFENRTGRLRYLEADFAVDGVPLAENKWMITVGEGLMEAVAAAYMFKNMSMKDWLIYSEKHGSPGIVGKTNAKKGMPQWDNMAEAIKNIAIDFGAVVSQEESIEKIDFSSQGNLPYPPLVQLMNEAIARIWRGADLSTLSKGHGQGQGASLQGEESDILEEAWCRLVSETLNAQIDRKVISWYRGPNVRPLAYIKVSMPQRRDIALDIQTDEFLVQHGVRLSTAAICERYGREEADDTEFDILTPSAATPFGGGGGMPGDPNSPEDVSGNGNGRFQFGRRNGNGKPKEDLSAIANEGVQHQRMVLRRGMQELAKTQATVLHPIIEHLQGILDMPNKFAFEVALEQFLEKLPTYLAQINAHPATAKAMEGNTVASFFNGLAEAAVKRHVIRRG